MICFHFLEFGKEASYVARSAAKSSEAARKIRREHKKERLPRKTGLFINIISLDRLLGLEKYLINW